MMNDESIPKKKRKKKKTGTKHTQKNKKVISPVWGNFKYRKKKPYEKEKYIGARKKVNANFSNQL